MSRQLAAALVAGFILLMALATSATGAAKTVFLDTAGNTLEVDTAASTFAFSSPSYGNLSGTNVIIKPNRRFAFTAKNAQITLIAQVDLPRSRVNATLVNTSTRRWLTTMRDATTTIPRSPTATPTAALDAFRVVGDGVLVDEGRSFRIDVFRNPREPIRGKLSFNDVKGRISLASVPTKFNMLTVENGEARIRGVGIFGATRSELAFEVVVRDASVDGQQSFQIRIGNQQPIQDKVKFGRVRLGSRSMGPPAPTYTPSPTRAASYTPTRTPTPLPTNTPLPTWTPTPAIV